MRENYFHTARCISYTDCVKNIQNCLYMSEIIYTFARRDSENNIIMVLTMRTKIMAAVLLVALIFAWQPAQAKDEPKDDGDKHELITIKYCDSYKDLHYGNWHTADSVWVIIKSNTKKHVNGGVYYKFNSDNKKLEKHLLKKAFAVSYNDTLLINARTYKVTSGYAHGFRMTDGRIVFKCFRGYNPSEAVIAVSAMGG